MYRIKETKLADCSTVKMQMSMIYK